MIGELMRQYSGNLTDRCKSMFRQQPALYGVSNYCLTRPKHESESILHRHTLHKFLFMEELLKSICVHKNLFQKAKEITCLDKG